MMGVNNDSIINVPFHDVPFYDSELTPNSTSFDYVYAAKSDDIRKLIWGWRATLSGAASMITMTIFLGMLCSPKVRTSPFNLYIIFMLIPDISLELIWFVNGTANAINARFWSLSMCYVESFFTLFGVTANCWFNALIVYHLYTILKLSHQRKKYRLLSTKEVLIHSLCIYTWAAFVASWAFLNGIETTKQVDTMIQSLIVDDNIGWWRVRTQLKNGLACYPHFYNTQSMFFLWFVCLPCIGFIPMIYVLYSCYSIWKMKLLPPKGKRRTFAVFFFRIVFVFFAFWAPCFLMAFTPGSLYGKQATWFLSVANTFAILQGPVSAFLCSTKPDILKAVRRFLTFQCCSEDEDDDKMNVEGFDKKTNQNKSTVFISGLGINTDMPTSSISLYFTNNVGDFTERDITTSTEVGDLSNSPAYINEQCNVKKRERTAETNFSDCFAIEEDKVTASIATPQVIINEVHGPSSTQEEWIGYELDDDNVSEAESELSNVPGYTWDS